MDFSSSSGVMPIYVPILFFSWPVLWILLYGYVIFPHVATEKNLMLSCVSCVSCDWEPHYTEPGSVDGEPDYTEQCELNRTQIWLHAFFAGVGSALVAGWLILSMIFVMMSGRPGWPP